MNSTISPSIRARSSSEFLHRLGMIVISALLFGACCIGVIHADPPQNESISERNFTFSSDPSVEILAITFRRGLQRTKPFFRIYGDGRVEIFHPGTAKQSGSRTWELAFEEMRGLLRFAVDHNLAESSREDIEEKILAKYPGDIVPHATDGHDMIFSIRLTSFSRDGVDLGPRENTIVIHYPAFLLRISPDVEELQGLVGLQRRLLDLQQMPHEEKMS